MSCFFQREKLPNAPATSNLGDVAVTRDGDVVPSEKVTAVHTEKVSASPGRISTQTVETSSSSSSSDGESSSASERFDSDLKLRRSKSEKPYKKAKVKRNYGEHFRTSRSQMILFIALTSGLLINYR